MGAGCTIQATFGGRTLTTTVTNTRQYQNTIKFNVNYRTVSGKNRVFASTTTILAGSADVINHDAGERILRVTSKSCNGS